MGYDIGAFEYNPISKISNTHFSQNLIDIYPNPFAEKLTIEIKDKTQQIHSIYFYNVYGKEIQNILITRDFRQNIVINRANLLTGIYFLSIQTGDQIIGKKVIIQ